MKKILSVIITVSLLIPFIFSLNVFAEGYDVFYDDESDDDIVIIDGIKYVSEETFCAVLDTHESISGSVVIPASVQFGDAALPVTSVYDWSFENRHEVTDVTLPDTVTEICDGAFYRCTGLESINIPSGVTEIRYWTFCDCEKLDNVVLPEGVQTIGEDAFSYCYSLKNINIPESVKVISKSAFESSTALASITIPENVTEIALYAFNACSAMQSIEVDKNNAYYSSKDGVLFNKDQTVLIQYCCGAEGDYSIPDGVVEIGECAFGWSTLLTGVNIPDSVKKIDFAAFGGCAALTSIRIPANVEVIENAAFADCTELASFTVDDTGAYFKADGGVLFSKDGTTLISFPNKKSSEYIIPDTVTEIRSNAFHGCYDLTKLTVPDSVAVLGNYAFEFCDYLEYNEYEGAYYLGNDTNKYVVLVYVPDKTLDSVKINDNTKFIYSDAFINMDCLKSITIPDSVLSIGSYAFCNCDSLAKINISENVNRISAYAFENCTSITNITLPDSLTDIGEGAFYSCVNLKSIIIPDGVTEIGEWAFGWCEELDSIVIPESVVVIGTCAFTGCDELKTVYYKGSEEKGKDIYIDYGNEAFLEAKIIFNSGDGLPGDCSGDGAVDNKDVVTLFRYVSGGEKEADETVYDFNYDGEVNNKDVVELFRFVSTK